MNPRRFGNIVPEVKGESELKQFYEIYTLAPASSSLVKGRCLQADWDLGRLRNLPLWTEFVVFFHYPANWFYIHQNPTQACFEIPVHGQLTITHRDRKLTLKPGEIYLLPAGESNRLETVGKNYCSKWSLGICGNLLEQLLPGLFHDHLHFSVKDTAPFIALIRDLQDLLREKKPDSVPRIAALTLQFLMELALQVPADIPPQLAEAVRIFEFNLGKPVGIRRIAAELNLPEARLAAMFKEHFGVTPKRYQVELRRKRAEQLLRESSLPIKEIAQRLGYGAPQFFTREFDKDHGCSPRAFREKEREKKH